MIPLLDIISKEIRVPLWMNMSSRAKRQIELNHEESNKEQTKQKKIPKPNPRNKTVIERSTASLLLCSSHLPISK